MEQEDDEGNRIEKTIKDGVKDICRNNGAPEERLEDIAATMWELFNPNHASILARIAAGDESEDEVKDMCMIC